MVVQALLNLVGMVLSLNQEDYFKSKHNLICMK